MSHLTCGFCDYARDGWCNISTFRRLTAHIQVQVIVDLMTLPVRVKQEHIGLIVKSDPVQKQLPNGPGITNLFGRRVPPIHQLYVCGALHRTR